MEANPLIHMVRLAGIEPTTPWFVAKYSIQLSYSRVAVKAERYYSMSVFKQSSGIRSFSITTLCLVFVALLIGDLAEPAPGVLTQAEFG